MITRRLLLALAAALPLWPVPAQAVPTTATCAPCNAHLYALIQERVEQSLGDYIDSNFYPFEGAFSPLARHWLEQKDLGVAVEKAVAHFYDGMLIKNLRQRGLLAEEKTGWMNLSAQIDALSIFPITPDRCDQAFFGTLLTLAPR